MIIKGMQGLGDNIYQRAFVRKLTGSVFLETAWPELYEDLPGIKFLRPDTKLRTQLKNSSRYSGYSERPSPGVLDVRVQYGNTELQRGSIVEAMSGCFGFGPGVFNLPPFSGPQIDGPYAVIRPVTVRREWRNEARSPLAEYVCQAAEYLRNLGVKVVSVADLQPGGEWLVGDPPPSDIRYHRGELDVTRLLGLIRGASVVVGGVGWIVPASLAYGVPLVTILGGQGMHNAPEKITHRGIDLSRAQWIYPDRYCRCASMKHKCDKEISDFEGKFKGAIKCLNL